jgi:uncharacterized membrane protein YheB (UPF0754 family)
MIMTLHQKKLSINDSIISDISIGGKNKIVFISYILLTQIMSKEFRFIEIVGAVLGLIIGFVQVLITLVAA